MAALSNICHQLCSKITLLFAFLVIELIILIWKLTSDTRPITTRQFLKFIEEKHPTIRYTKKLKVEEHVECSVCLSEFKEGDKVRSLECKHTFHRDCLDKWLREYWATCPLCRKQVLPDEVVSKYRELQNQDGLNGNDEQLPYMLSALRGGSRSNLRRFLGIETCHPDA